jgi:hypothetical protein
MNISFDILKDYLMTKLTLPEGKVLGNFHLGRIWHQTVFLPNTHLHATNETAQACMHLQRKAQLARSYI